MSDNQIVDGYLHFRLKDGLSIILDAHAWRAVSSIRALSHIQAQDEILKTYAVPSACSADLRDDVAESPAALRKAAAPRTPGSAKRPKTPVRQAKKAEQAMATPSTKRARMRSVQGAPRTPR